MNISEGITYTNYIAGEPASGRTRRVFNSYNPTTGAVWGTFTESSRADVDDAVEAATLAFNGPWSRISNTQRGRLLMMWGEEIAANAEAIATIETSQNGKLIAEMRAQAKIVKEWLYYYGGLADKIEGRQIPLERRSVLNYTLREPLGVVAVIVPWNSPTLLTIMTCAPALSAGNTVVIKPSELSSASAFKLVQLAEEAGIPPGVINIVTGGKEAGEALVDHPKVSKVSFTGSEAVGREIAARAGRRLVGCTLELGGKSPNIVFEDANLAQAEAGLLSGIFSAAGQTCIAGSRAYLHRKIYDQLLERVVGKARKIRLGDPTLPGTEIGPVVSQAHLKRITTMVEHAIADGGELLCGGRRSTSAALESGYFIEPAVLHNLTPTNHILREEVFGPVLAVIPFDTEEEVVVRANDTRFGLAAGVWTTDLSRAHRMARQLQAGTVWINTYRALSYNSPFGGYKSSGLGRLNGIEAIDHFLQTKSVWCELSNEVQEAFVLKL